MSCSQLRDRMPQAPAAQAIRHTFWLVPLTDDLNARNNVRTLVECGLDGFEMVMFCEDRSVRFKHESEAMVACALLYS